MFSKIHENKPLTIKFEGARLCNHPKSPWVSYLWKEEGRKAGGRMLNVRMSHDHYSGLRSYSTSSTPSIPAFLFI